MAAAIVQAVSKSSASSGVGAPLTLSIGSADGWSAPSSSNYVIAFANSDDVFTWSGTATQRTHGGGAGDGSFLNDQQASVIDYGNTAPTTVTITNASGGGSSPATLTLVEISGISSFDIAGNWSTHIFDGGHGSDTAPSVTTTAANDAILIAAFLHGMNFSTGTPTSQTPPAGYTAVAGSTSSPANTGTAILQTANFVAIGTQATTGATGTQTLSYSPAGGRNSVAVMIALKITTGGSTATATLSGSGSLSAGTPKPAVHPAAALSGSGSLSVGVVPKAVGTAALSGSGTLTATGSGSSPVTGPATLSGSGTLSTVQLPKVPGVAALSGSGSLSLVTPTGQTVALSGNGQLFVTAGLPELLIVDHGDGTFDAYGSAVTDNGDGTFTINSQYLTDNGDGSFTANGQPNQGIPKALGAAALSGSGTLSASTSGGSATTTAALSGSGSLSVATGGGSAATAALSGSGTLSASPKPGQTATAALSGSGSLTAGASGGAGAVFLSGSGQLSVVTLPKTAGTAALSGSGTLTAVRAGFFIGAYTDPQPNWDYGHLSVLILLWQGEDIFRKPTPVV